VSIGGQGPLAVDWSVFTIAFRKIDSGSLDVGNGGIYQWDLKDKSGALVARGLYYLRLDVKGPAGGVKKILKILVL
jgi:hypothetical protein